MLDCYYRYCDKGKGIVSGEKPDWLEATPDGTQADVAEAFGVSRARVCQMLGLFTKLPAQVTERIAEMADPELCAFFTERRLRSVATLATDHERGAGFRELQEQLRGVASREH